VKHHDIRSSSLKSIEHILHINKKATTQQRT